MSKSWTLEVKEDTKTGDAILEFPDDLMQEAGWKEGDTLEWIDNKDGSWTMKKKELTQWVLVECVSTFRERYMVEVPVGVKHRITNDHDVVPLVFIEVQHGEYFGEDDIVRFEDEYGRI